MLVFCVLISALSISVNFYFESLDVDPTISKTVKNISKQFSDRILDGKISIVPQNVMYYDEYSKIYKDLSRCAGSENVNCRVNALNSVDFVKKDVFKNTSKVTFVFISTPKINEKQDIFIDFNICNSIFIINIHSDSMHVLVENSLKKYMQLISNEIRRDKADKKTNVKELEEKLKLCDKLYSYGNNKNNLDENNAKNTDGLHTKQNKEKKYSKPFKYEKNQLQGKFIKIQSDSNEDVESDPNGFLIKN